MSGAPGVATQSTLLAALEVRMPRTDAGNDITVRDYLHTLLRLVWEEGEGFNGKRPFGNSGWEWELYTPLVKAGYLAGTLGIEAEDEWCDMNPVQRKAADAFVLQLIRTMCYGGQKP